MRNYHRPYMSIITQVHTSTGAAPLLPSAYNNKGRASRGVLSFESGSSRQSPSLFELKRIIASCHGRLYQKDEASFQQRRLVLVNSRKGPHTQHIIFSIRIHGQRD